MHCGKVFCFDAQKIILQNQIPPFFGQAMQCGSERFIFKSNRVSTDIKISEYFHWTKICACILRSKVYLVHKIVKGYFTQSFSFNLLVAISGFEAHDFFAIGIETVLNVRSVFEGCHHLSPPFLPDRGLLQKPREQLKTAHAVTQHEIKRYSM